MCGNTLLDCVPQHLVILLQFLLLFFVLGIFFLAYLIRKMNCSNINVEHFPNSGFPVKKLSYFQRKLFCYEQYGIVILSNQLRARNIFQYARNFAKEKCELNQIKI